MGGRRIMPLPTIKVSTDKCETWIGIPGLTVPGKGKTSSCRRWTEGDICWRIGAF